MVICYKLEWQHFPILDHLLHVVHFCKMKRNISAYIFKAMRFINGPGSSVGIATGYGLDGPEIEPRWGVIFRTRSNRPWGPPSLLYNGQSGRGVVLTTHSLLLPRSPMSRAIPLPPLGFRVR
jgi:hypothetical protein